MKINGTFNKQDKIHKYTNKTNTKKLMHTIWFFGNH